MMLGFGRVVSRAGSRGRLGLKGAFSRIGLGVEEGITPFTTIAS